LSTVTTLASSAAPSFVTSCNFNGQCVAGGILESLSYSREWEDLGLADVWWSGVGSFEFRPEEDRTAGFATMPWSNRGEGRVLNIVKNGETPIVFGDHGIVQLLPYGNEVITGYGVGPNIGLGIRETAHVAGDDNVSLVLDRDDELWLVQGGEFNKLGYKEWMEDLTSANIIVSYVPQKKRFFISDGVTGYAMTEQGLYTTNQLVSSAGFYEEQYVGFYGDDADYELRFETDTFDGGQRGMKTLTEVELGADYVKGTNRLQVATKFKNANNSVTYTQTGWKTLNTNGVAYPLITSPDLRVLVRGADYRDATLNIHSLHGRLKMSDKRFLRGEMELRSSGSIVRGSNVG
jgi:hypothetical protein